MFRLFWRLSKLTTMIYFRGFWNGSDRQLRFAERVGRSSANQRSKSFQLRDRRSRSIREMSNFSLSVEVCQEKWPTVDGRVGPIGKELVWSQREIVDGRNGEEFGLARRYCWWSMGRWLGVDWFGEVFQTKQEKSPIANGSMVGCRPNLARCSGHLRESIDGWWRKEGDDVSCHVSIHVSCHVIQVDTSGWCVMPCQRPHVMPR